MHPRGKVQQGMTESSNLPMVVVCQYQGGHDVGIRNVQAAAFCDGITYQHTKCNTRFTTTKVELIIRYSNAIAFYCSATKLANKSLCITHSNKINTKRLSIF